MTRGQRVYDWWSRHPRLFDVAAAVAFGGRYRDLRREAVDGLALSPGESVLDLACGTGVVLPDLAASVAPGGRVVGLDYSAGMVRAAGDRLEGDADLPATAAVLRGDGTRLPFPDRCFDAVQCALALTAMPGYERAVSEIHRVLSPGGRLAVFDTRAFQSGPLRLLNPLVRRVSGAATNWDPDRDVLGALESTFGAVDIRDANRGTAYVAVARRRE